MTRRQNIPKHKPMMIALAKKAGAWFDSTQPSTVVEEMLADAVADPDNRPNRAPWVLPNRAPRIPIDPAKLDG